MALLDINWNPDKKQLRIFVLLLAVFSCVFAGIHYLRTYSHNGAMIIVGVGFAVAITGAIVPPLARVVYVIWMALAFPIGWTISHTVMALVYYLIFTPIALVMRLAGRDALRRKLDPNLKTYWQEHRQPENVSRYFRQF